jgi:Cu+-exporting ATPase
MKDNLLDVVTAYDLSRSTIRNIKENLFWAFFYNCLGIPVAMGLLYPAFGILLSPMFGAAAMSLSSVTVCLNALRLRLFKAPAYHAKDIEETPAKEIKEYSLHEEGAKPENRSDEKPAEIEKTEAGNDAKEENGAQTLSFHVSGMSCAHCKAAVEKAALSVPGVTGAEVNLEKENLQVQAEKSDVKEAVEKAVADAGYEAKLESPDQEFVFHVDGMSCSHCQNAVTKALQEVPGVKSAQVDLESQTAAVAGDHSVTESALKTAVDNSGYEARF